MTPITLSLTKDQIQNIVAALDLSVGASPQGQRLQTASVLLPIAALLSAAVQDAEKAPGKPAPVAESHAE